MLSEAVLHRIETTIAEVNPEAFVVDISFKKGKKSTLYVRVDTDKGISLSECTDISRALGQQLEEEKELDIAYRLEVSSPGVGFPLKLHRQYVQNLGRHLSVINHGGHEIQGKLLEVEEKSILIEPIV
ncbi:MAG: ribosome assembly cofactor RimP, partial [Bacteroidota bacterium]